MSSINLGGVIKVLSVIYAVGTHNYSHTYTHTIASTGCFVYFSFKAAATRVRRLTNKGTSFQEAKQSS